MMNLKEFLKAKTDVLPITEEVLFPVVLGVGSFTPFHMGYLPMVSKVVSESERFRCDPIMVVIDNEFSAFAVQKLKEMAPNLKVMVRPDMATALSDLSQHQRGPIAIYTDTKNQVATQRVCEQMYPMSAIEVTQDGYVPNLERKIQEALEAGNFLKFHANHIECPLIESRNMFNSLRGTNGNY